MGGYLPAPAATVRQLFENDESNLRKFVLIFFFSSRRRHTIFKCDWSSDVCSSDLCVSRRFSDLRRQLVAKQSTSASQQMLEARNQAPPLVVELPVHAAFLLATVATSVLAIERMLLAGIDAADDPTQKHQHSDLTLQIVHKDELVRRDCSQVVNTDVVTRYTEPRPQTETG